MTKVFISFAEEDLEYAETVRDRVEQWKHSTWMFTRDSRPGKYWVDEIDKALQLSDVVVGLLSPDALESRNVKDEWDWAIKNDNKSLLLLRIRECEVPFHYDSISYIDLLLDVTSGYEKLEQELANLRPLEPSTTLPKEVQEHMDKYWRLCREFFTRSDFALAVAFALLLLEEVGMATMLGFKQLPRAPIVGDMFQDDEPSKVIAALSGEAKIELAVNATMPINSRVNRIYTFEEDTFAKWFREKQFPTIRKRALHVIDTDAGAQAPSQMISKRDAYILVCMAGEVYGEIQSLLTGVSPEEWARILKEVDAFREANKPTIDAER